MRERIRAKYGYEAHPVSESEIVGIAENVRLGEYPINGVRCSPEKGTTGWYVWSGEVMSKGSDFFEPVHVAHISDWCPQIIPYLELPPGWRFLIAPGHEDVWFDPEVDLLDMGSEAGEP